MSTMRIPRVLLLALLVVGCYPEGSGLTGGRKSQHIGTRVDGGGAPDGANDGGLPPETGPLTALCLPAHGQPIPARSSTISGQAVGSDPFMTTEDLFRLFKTQCGACHVESDQGDFKVTLATFARKVEQTAIDRILSDDPDKYMPPDSAEGKPASQRVPGDPVLQLASLLQVWIKAGSPGDLFYLPREKGDAGVSPYLFTKELAGALTNIGNCIPDSKIIGLEKDEMARLDAVFEGATTLPKKLSDTDLVTLNAETLARYGVIAFAPGYPLWSDDAGKLRLVRVPVGQSIHFDEATQKFEIPPNTRFYKTFLKKVIDVTGKETYKKIETRIILARPDTTKDGVTTQNALFGTYIWEDDETSATLNELLLNDNKPFPDVLKQYVTDEVKAQALLATNPRSKTGALQSAGLMRHYAIPGSQRCIDCHMGAPSASFVLGFTPLQISRRKKGEGGVIEPSAADEVTQLQRLIDYGVITGIDDPSKVLPLERSEGTRTPRNDYELTAQAYMLGNCSHCHNPRGLPTVQNPELAGVLDFLPSEQGGVFEFPLNHEDGTGYTSPRIKRGPAQDIPIPYITPALSEYPVAGNDDPFGLIATGVWHPKEYDVAGTANGTDIVYSVQVYAPWRSLIYRNVDTPFTYSDYYSIYPHMPMNVPGYDCRIRKILGDWMVSIPSKRKDPTTDAYAEHSGETSHPLDLNPQPYVEVKKDDPDYKVALLEAQDRLTVYHQSKRYKECPDTSDIVDPSVQPPTKLVPTPVIDKDNWNSGVPEHPHWVVTDLTDLPGDWYPRRSDWKKVLVQGIATTLPDEQKAVVRILQGLTLSDELRKFALTDVPFGFWRQKTGCDFSKVRTVSSYTGAARPSWFDVAAKLAPVNPSDPVYEESPAAAVFNNICINCHGAKADSRGRLAQTLNIMTGGDTRVANLRDGLFGPTSKPGDNRRRVFGDAAKFDGGALVSVDDWASHYVAWMGLGGTSRTIPQGILSTVANTPVLGTLRSVRHFDPPSSANMLQTAQQLCAQVLGVAKLRGDISFDIQRGEIDHADPEGGTALITSNGDSAMWESLCRVGNPMPVRIIRRDGDWTKGDPHQFVIQARGVNWYKRAAYPAGSPIGDQRGKVASAMQPDNVSPWCLLGSTTDSAQQATAEAYAQAHPLSDGNPIPICPVSLFADPANALDDQEVADWSLRGAINAGFSVYLYLDGIVGGTLQPKVPFDQCDLLK